MLHYIAVTFRRLIRKPSYSVPAVLALTLAIGANTSVFSIVNAVLLRRLPYPDPSRLVVVSSVRLKTGKTGAASRLDMEAWRKSSTLIADFTGMYALRYTAIALGEPTVTDTAVISSSFFDITGVKPILGRAFTKDEEKYGSEPVVLISRSFWQKEFGGDAGAVGKSITLDTKRYTVIGVLDSAARFPVTVQKADLWVPMVPVPTEPRSVRGLTVIARLKPGATLQQAQSEMDGIAKRLGETVPSDIGFGVSLSFLQNHLVGRVRTALWFLQGAVAFLLLIACANVAHLALVAALGRANEIGVQAALGANRRQILLQLTTEGLLLGIIGALLGSALAYGGVQLFLRTMPDTLPRLDQVQIDLPVLGFTILISCVAALLFSLAPAAMVARGDLADFLRRSGRTVGASSGRRLRSTLVVSEVALTLILTVGAGTLLRSLLEIVQTPWGFEPNGVLAMNVVLPYTVYGHGQKSSDFFEKALDKIQQLHGVNSAGISLTLPFSGDGLSTVVIPQNRPEPQPGQEYRARYRPISPGYFKTLGIPLLRGRDFESRDRTGAQGVAIVDDTLAKQLWPGSDPIGQRLVTRIKISPNDPRDWEVVGIVSAIKDSHEDSAAPSHIYVPHLQQGWSLMSLVVKTNGEPLALARDVTQAIRSLNPGQAVQDVNTMNDRISKSVALPRLYAVLLSIFATIGLVLSCIGIYGAIAYSVSLRTREFGVRMALGAERSDILRLIVGQGGLLVGAGLILGAGGAFALNRSLTAFSGNIRGITALVFCLVVALVAITGLVACYVPAKRASRLDPSTALRYE